MRKTKQDSWKEKIDPSFDELILEAVVSYQWSGFSLRRNKKGSNKRIGSSVDVTISA